MLPCFAPSVTPSLPLHTVSPAALPALLTALPAPAAGFIAASGFAARGGELVLLPGETGGLSGAVLGLGSAPGGLAAFGGAARSLPEGTVWHLTGEADHGAATLGWALGAYHYARFKAAKRAPARLVVPADGPPAVAEAAMIAEVVWATRDLVNHPANVLGPAELAEAVAEAARVEGASVTLTSGATLEQLYPTIAMVGRGSARAPVVADVNWTGPGAGPDSPLVVLCGKGVCFDTGGYDLKPSSGMLRMKKDMGGAAVALGIARLVMAARLPVRLRLLVGAVENAVGPHAMRPLDVVRTRKGLTVEIGNTDAEGRLVLCDLLADACSANPAVLLDFATLTGAARVAVGPDLGALFANDDTLANELLVAGQAVEDPLWRLPLWPGYDAWLDSGIADLNNVASKPQAGAVIAALFLQRFVSPAIPWAHIDLYAWNDSARPGRPEGGEATAMRAVFRALSTRFASPGMPGGEAAPARR